MGKLAEVKAEVARLDTKILEANQEVGRVLNEMRAAGQVYPEAEGIEREKRLRSARTRRQFLQYRRDQFDFDFRCREAWGENWDAARSRGESDVDGDLVIGASRAVAIVEGESSLHVLKRVLRGGVPARASLLERGRQLMGAFEKTFREGQHD